MSILNKASELATTPQGQQSMHAGIKQKLDNQIANGSKLAGLAKGLYNALHGDGAEEGNKIRKDLQDGQGNQRAKAERAREEADRAREMSTANWVEVGDALKSLQKYMKAMKESGEMDDNVLGRATTLGKGLANSALDGVPFARSTWDLLKGLVTNVKNASNNQQQGENLDHRLAREEASQLSSELLDSDMPGVERLAQRQPHSETAPAMDEQAGISAPAMA